MQCFISLRSVEHALKERGFWACCAALSTVTAMPVGPNLRVLRAAVRWRPRPLQPCCLTVPTARACAVLRGHATNGRGPH